MCVCIDLEDLLCFHQRKQITTTFTYCILVHNVVSYLCYCIVAKVPYLATLVNTSTILKSVTRQRLLIYC
jgi:hypothetical protein